MNELTERDAAGQKIWQAGTLTYATGSIVILFLWLFLGTFAWSAGSWIVQTAEIMVRSFEFSDLIYGLLTVYLSKFINAVLVPVISYRSDRHRGRFGRRIPYLIFLTPLVVIGAIGLGLAPQMSQAIQDAIGSERISFNKAFLLIFGFFWLILNLGYTLTYALLTALINDVVPARLIGRFLALLPVIALIPGVLFNYFAMQYVDTHATIIVIALGLIYGCGLWAMCRKVKEGGYPPPRPEPIASRGFRGAVRAYFRECFSLPYYRWAIGAYVLCSCAVVPVNIGLLSYALNSGMTLNTLGTFQAIPGLMILLCYVFGSLADRFHPLRVGIVAMTMLTAVLLCGGFFIRGTVSFGIVFCSLMSINYAYNTLTASYAQRLFPRAIFAQFYSALLLVSVLTTTLVTALAGKLIKIIGTEYYYLTFPAGGLLGLAGTIMLVITLRYYRRLGGDRNYQAPLPTATVELTVSNDSSPRS